MARNPCGRAPVTTNGPSYLASTGFFGRELRQRFPLDGNAAENSHEKMSAGKPEAHG